MIIYKLIFFKENATTSWDVARSPPQEMERAAQRLTASIGYMGASICFSFLKKTTSFQLPFSCLWDNQGDFPFWGLVTGNAKIRDWQIWSYCRGWQGLGCGIVWNCMELYRTCRGCCVWKGASVVMISRRSAVCIWDWVKVVAAKMGWSTHTHKSRVSWRSTVLNLEGSVHETKLVISTSSSKILNKCVCAYKMYNSYWPFAWWTHFLILLMHF